jgi:phosphoesterase RecJ-like protein
MQIIQTEILETIKQFDTIIIHRHQRPDPDAFGSQLGLKQILKDNFPEKKIYAVGYDNPGLEWIGKMDNIEDHIYDNALVIVTDTADTPRIEDRRFKLGKVLIKIDHHPNNDNYGDLIWVEDDASSTSELITRFVNESHELKLSDASARYLYIGIAGDTGRFMYATKPSTMRIAAELLEFNINASDINRKMSSITLQQAKFSAKLNEVLAVNEDVGYLVITQKMIKDADIGEDGTQFAVGIPGQIDIVKAWALFIEEDEPKGFKYRVRLRSKKAIINGIAERHHGGGHEMAAGAKAIDELEIQQIIAELKEEVKKV